jgi:hypothetical protein
MEELKYPIGRFSMKSDYTQEEIEGFKDKLATFPKRFKEACDGLSTSELQKTYRTGGWTAQQVIHHVSDSHGNMLIRLKWSLTEESPKIKAYFEDKWASLADYSLSHEISLNQIEIIHAKVMAIINGFSEEDLEKGYIHPQDGNFYPLKGVLALYAWHGEHHLAHIEICRK